MQYNPNQHTLRARYRVLPRDCSVRTTKLYRAAERALWLGVLGL